MNGGLIIAVASLAALVIVLGVLRLRRLSLASLVLIVMGTVIGLVLGALASVPLGKLSQPLGGILAVVVSAVLTLMTIITVWSRRESMQHMMPFLRLKPTAGSGDSGNPAARILVDTSVIIDGRIADIAVAGFVPGRLIVPRFVLAELQNIADSEDAMRRGRGRRGLEVLNRLRETPGIEVEVTDEDVSSIREVDAKLVALALRFSCNVLTTDYNLNRVAQIQGVRVLNINELANAIRPVVLPGEELYVRVVQPGKEKNQGVGYLADGTMIVVENGDKLMGQEVNTEVTRVFQTVAGKMIFAVPRDLPAGRQDAAVVNHVAQGTGDAKAGDPISARSASARGRDGVVEDHERTKLSRMATVAGPVTKPPLEDKRQPESPKPKDESAQATEGSRRGSSRNGRGRRGQSRSTSASSIEDRLVQHNQGDDQAKR